MDWNQGADVVDHRVVEDHAIAVPVDLACQLALLRRPGLLLTSETAQRSVCRGRGAPRDGVQGAWAGRVGDLPPHVLGGVLGGCCGRAETRREIRAGFGAGPHPASMKTAESGSLLDILACPAFKPILDDMSTRSLRFPGPSLLRWPHHVVRQDDRLVLDASGAAVLACLHVHLARSCTESRSGQLSQLPRRLALVQAQLADVGPKQKDVLTKLSRRQ